MENGKIRKTSELQLHPSLASHISDHDLRAGINFPDAFVLDPIVTAQAVRGAERFVTLAARMLFHLLY